ncbi:hypothetical protein ASE01_08675 [Nocardioides sp. Root190]|uniref:hypothetical protein n=1 Tax=Nocardioides sp. Root190 TaxID=1736488 RepID=UPI0006FF19E6|nr:hypothetical protein [Nocardioides sp. Root190]KRB76838.1 hypothetical protein ASE01_08675 [Nocardioides sp. Root190]
MATSDQLAPLWVSTIPTYGRVLAVLVDGEYAAVLDDMNGDGREVELGVHKWEAGRWKHWGGQDDVDLPFADGPPHHGWGGEVCWVIGRTRAGGRVEVEWFGEQSVVVADAEGWWLAVLPVEHVEGELDEWTGQRRMIVPHVRTLA